MADIETGCSRFVSLLNEACSVLRELLQNVILVQELNGLLVPGKFKRKATVSTDGWIHLLDERFRLVFAIIEPLVIYIIVLFTFFID